MEDETEFKGQTLGGMFIIDEEGAKELEAIEERFLARMREIEAESKKRAAETGEPTQPYRVGLFRKYHRPSSN